MTRSSSSFKYADLFAGIGGFAAALRALGGEGVYSVEIDKAAARVYERNWGHNPLGDVTLDANDDTMNVGEHDILAAGFPCQPFSKSGAQRGMDETRGTLYWNILRIIEKRTPTIVLLENVRNLAGPRHEHELEVILSTLRERGYEVADEPAVLSPHQLPPQRGGRPQVRERVFIAATHDPKGLADKHQLPRYPLVSSRERIDGWDPQKWELERDLPLSDEHIIPGCQLTKPERLWIDAWDKFVKIMWERVREGGEDRLPGFPIWADSWHHYEEPIPLDLPDWKRSHLRKNYAFYSAHKDVLDDWAEDVGLFTDAFPASRRKFEWQAQETPSLWEAVMHFRPSGIRAKAPTYLPALVAITQTSIIGPRERRLSPREAARLQGLPDGFDFGDQPPAATYRQLGNGVNVGAVWFILREHVRRHEPILKSTARGRRILQAVLDAPESPDPILRQMFQTGR